MDIIKLKNATKDCGGKAYGLSNLINNNINVPDGFVIKNSCDLHSIKLENLKKNLQKFNKNQSFAIRSSANVEDGSLTSFAGVFKTILNVKNDYSLIYNAINEINNNLNNEKVTSYYNNNDVQMNIIIQKMIKSKISGICFTNAIDIDGNKSILFEYVSGDCDSLVSGKSNSNRIIIRYNDDNEIDLSTIRLEGILLDFTEINDLIKVIQKIINTSKYDLDIEWSIDEDGTPFILQSRPITKTIFINNFINRDKSHAINVSKGITTGETYVIDSNLSYDDIQKKINEFPANKILVTEFTETYYLPAMKKASGIITNTGSCLCHAAIVARELGIPCIVGMENATKKFPTGSKIILDAINNQIIMNEKKEKMPKKFMLDFGELDYFDNYFCLNINNVKIFIESTFDGIIVHKPNDINHELINEIELFIRRNFNSIPKYSIDDNKYLWIKEIERFKLLPYFNIYLELIKKTSKELNGNHLIQLQKELINYAKLLIDFKKTNQNIIVSIFIEETIASINELLEGIIPFGYPIYYAYLESLNLLEKENLSFTDLFNDNIKIKNKKLNSIIKFLKQVTHIKDTSYKIIWELGGNDPDYFEKRDKRIQEILTKNNIKFEEDYVDIFYNIYLNKYFSVLEKIYEK